MLNGLASLLNRVNDWDLTWVGFQALRPAPDQPMTARVVATLCLVYCPLAAILGFALAWFILPQRAPPQMPWLMAGATAALFVLLQSFLAWAWNRRARQSRAEELKSSD